MKIRKKPYHTGMLEIEIDDMETWKEACIALYGDDDYNEYLSDSKQELKEKYVHQILRYIKLKRIINETN